MHLCRNARKKGFELRNVAKGAAAVVESVTGVKVTVFARIGAQVAEFASVTNLTNLADFEEKTTRLLASSECQAVVKKFEGLAIPGENEDRLMREI